MFNGATPIGNHDRPATMARPRIVQHPRWKILEDFSMRAVSLLLALSISAVTTQAQTAEPPPLPSITLPPELARVLTDYETQWRFGGDSLIKLFAEDAILTVGGRPPARGRAAIASHYAGPKGPLALRAIAYAAEGNIAYIIGGYTMTRGEPDVGKFVLTLKKGADGRWLIFSDMDTGNAAMRRPAPPGR
jgi:ketosteroid isomerase-like protein